MARTMVASVVCLLACSEDPKGVAPPERAALELGGGLPGALLTEVWTAEPDETGSAYGSAVASAGDVNADGFDDVLVGAPAARFGSEPETESRFELFMGSSVGLEATPAWTYEQDPATVFFGYTVAAAGDVDGDGFGDVIVGESSHGNQFRGRAHVFRGSASGLEATPVWSEEGPHVESHFGSRVASAGDVDGDGFDDIVVSAWGEDDEQVDEGRVFVYRGSASGPEVDPAWWFEGDQEDIFLSAVASAGDVNGDGFDDLLAGAPSFDGETVDQGRAWLFLGSATGLGHSADWVGTSDQHSAWFGQTLAGAGDVNADGFDDFLVGMELGGENDEGSAMLFLGSALGPDTTSAWKAMSRDPNAQFGITLDGAGDVNGDGFDDVVVGAPKENDVETDDGRVSIYLGSATGLGIGPSWRVTSAQKHAMLGSSVAFLDANGDGFADMAAGASSYDSGEQDEGKVFVYAGGCEDGVGLAFVDSDADAIMDACDVCPGFDDTIDHDGDLIPDGCDP